MLLFPHLSADIKDCQCLVFGNIRPLMAAFTFRPECCSEAPRTVFDFRTVSRLPSTTGFLKPPETCVLVFLRLQCFRSLPVRCKSFVLRLQAGSKPHSLRQFFS